MKKPLQHGGRAVKPQPKSAKLPWFRLYARAVDDERLRLLAFEDRWHFVAILCLKCDGLLDAAEDEGLKLRRIGVKLGLASRELEEVRRRLMEVELIDASFQPLRWDALQFKSDRDETAAERQRKKRKRDKAMGGVTDASRMRHSPVTGPETDTETDTEAEEEVSSVEETAPPAARKKRSASAVACPDGVDPQAWEDWQKVRKAKRLPITPTALKGVEREAQKAGWTLAEAIAECAVMGWAGFKADWVVRGGGGHFRPSGQSGDGFSSALDRELGLGGRS